MAASGRGRRPAIFKTLEQRLAEGPPGLGSYPVTYAAPTEIWSEARQQWMPLSPAELKRIEAKFRRGGHMPRIKNPPPPGPWYYDRHELRVDAVLTPREQRGGYQEYVVIHITHPRMGGQPTRTIVDRDARGKAMSIPETAENTAARMADGLSSLSPNSPNPVNVYDHRGKHIYSSSAGRASAEQPGSPWA